VLGLLEGERMWIEPKDFEEIHQRGNTEAHRLQDPSKWVPFGVGAIEGQAGAPLRVLEPGQIRDAAPDAPAPGPAPEYGPGEEPRPREGEPTAAAHGELL
jgi:lysine 2,3-aminomutase